MSMLPNRSLLLIDDTPRSIRAFARSAGSTPPREIGAHCEGLKRTSSTTGTGRIFRAPSIACAAQSDSTIQLKEAAMNRRIACHQRLTSRSLLLGLLFGSAIPLSLLAAEAAPNTKGSPPAVADESALASLASVLPELRAGGYVIYFRHGVTDQNVADDSEPDFSRCETQRNLTVEGRAQAAQIGKAIHDLAIPIGAVITSPYCRTKDTASLAFGHFQVDHDLYFALNVDTAERARLTHALSRMLSTQPEVASNTVIIAHTANLRESTGFWPKPEGVAYVFKPMGMDQFVPVAKVLPDDWMKASAAAQ